MIAARGPAARYFALRLVDLPAASPNRISGLAWGFRPQVWRDLFQLSRRPPRGGPVMQKNIF
jgi:hypothetical protein